MIEEKELKEGNLLIADFMSSKKQDRFWFFDFLAEEFQNSSGWASEPYLYFHSSWKWVMPVVEKIESIECEKGTLSVLIRNFTCEIKNYVVSDDLIAFQEGDTKLEATWKAVVEFIKYFNNQKI